MQDLIDSIRKGSAAQAEQAARALKHHARANPSALLPLRRDLLALTLADREQALDLRVRWNLIVVLGLLPLRGRDRAAAADWLWQRLADPSPFTRTFALDALCNLAGTDAAQQARLRPVIEQFLAEGTPSMRARARHLLAQLSRAPPR